MTLLNLTPVRRYRRGYDDFQREVNGFLNNIIYRNVSSTNKGSYCPKTDISETKDDIIFRLELPGLIKDEVTITLEDDVLNVKGEKKDGSDSESDNTEYYKRERSFGDFQRAFVLTKKVKNDKINAVFENGILNICLPKAEEVKPKEIDIKIK